MAKSKGDEKNTEKGGATALIEVPICGEDDIVGPVIIHVDARLSVGHRVTLARIRTELARRHATLKDGRHVETVADVVRWMLEQVEAAA